MVLLVELLDQTPQVAFFPFDVDVVSFQVFVFLLGQYFVKFLVEVVDHVCQLEVGVDDLIPVLILASGEDSLGNFSQVDFFSFEARWIPGILLGCLVFFLG